MTKLTEAQQVSANRNNTKALRMKKVTTAVLMGGAIAVSSLLGTGLANASTADFLQDVQENIPYVLQQYGAAAVQTEGAHICAWEAAGITGASDLNDRIMAEMPMSSTAALHMQVYAEHDLGC